METVLKAYLPRIETMYEVVDGAYAFNERGKLKWLQKLCLKILDKLGCQYYNQAVEVKAILVDFDKVIDLIQAQRDAIEMTYGRRCKYAILGQNAMRRLNIECGDRFTFVLPAGPNRRFREFAGMRVILCPWFDGVLCLDEIEGGSY